MPRAMGWLEHYMHTVPNCNVIIASHVSGGLMDPAHFQRAVRATSERHPMLRSVINKESLSFVELDGFVPGPEHYEVVDSTDADEWKAIADKESNKDADMYGPQPLWKIILVRLASEGGGSNVLLVKFHHCIGDGSSGYIITHDVLRFCQHLEEHGDLGDIQPLPRLQSADQMSFPDGLGADDMPVVESLFEQFKKRRCEWSPSPGLSFDRKVGGAHNSTLYRDGSQESADALLALCRKKGITMGAVLVAATYFAIAEMDKSFCKKAAADPTTRFSFDFDMDVNLRKRLQTVLGNDHVGTIIGMMSFSLSLDGNTRFWDFVVEVRTAMTKFLESKYHLYYFTVNDRFDAASGAMPAFQDNLKRNDGLVQDMNFSTFGKYFFNPNYGRLTLEKAYATGAGWCPTFGSCVFLILGVTRNFYTFVYSTSDENSLVAAEFFNKAVDIIEEAHSFDDSYRLLDQILKPELRARHGGS